MLILYYDILYAIYWSMKFVNNAIETSNKLNKYQYICDSRNHEFKTLTIFIRFNNNIEF